MKTKRVDFKIEEITYNWLKQKSFEYKISMGELIRRIINCEYQEDQSGNTK